MVIVVRKEYHYAVTWPHLCIRRKNHLRNFRVMRSSKLSFQRKLSARIIHNEQRNLLPPLTTSLTRDHLCYWIHYKMISIHDADENWSVLRRLYNSVIASFANVIDSKYRFPSIRQQKTILTEFAIRPCTCPAAESEHTKEVTLECPPEISDSRLWIEYF